MSPTTRTLAWVAVLGMLLGAALGCILLSCTDHGRPVLGGTSPSVDTGRVVAVRDSLVRERAAHAHDLDSLMERLARSPDTVWSVARHLVRDTMDTGRVDTLRLISALVVDDSACRVDRDSLAGEVTLWKARDAAHAEAHRIAQERPVVVGDTSPPSRATWAAVGAGATVGVEAVAVGAFLFFFGR